MTVLNEGPLCLKIHLAQICVEQIVFCSGYAYNIHPKSKFVNAEKHGRKFFCFGCLKINRQRVIL